MTAPVRKKAPRAIARAWATAQDNATAAENLLRMMQADDELYREVVAPFERQAAMLAVQRKKLQQRGYVWNRPTAPDERVAALARTTALSLLDIRLTSGKRLGDATVQDVRREAEFYEARAREHGAKALFYTRIAERMKGRKTVAQVWSAAELEDIRDAA